jgi:hypothetical protein
MDFEPDMSSARPFENGILRIEATALLLDSFFLIFLLFVSTRSRAYAFDGSLVGTQVSGIWAFNQEEHCNFSTTITEFIE